VIANDARRHNVRIFGIDVNRSTTECLIEPDSSSEFDAVRLGFRYLKNLGEAAWKRLEEEHAAGEYRSLWDFWRRTRLGKEQIESLIRVGAFAWTGLHERQLLWQLGTFYQPLSSQLPLALGFNEAIPGLDEMNPHERIGADLSFIGLAVRGASMDLVSDQLHEGITPSHLLKEKRSGERVSVAGLVAVRQSPETAKGFVFHTLEDYHGLMNVITKPHLIEKYRWLIEDAPALIVRGHIERHQRSINVIAEHFEELHVTEAARRRVHNFG
jgi:DNA polymerase III alpha subunit